MVGLSCVVVELVMCDEARCRGGHDVSCWSSAMVLKVLGGAFFSGCIVAQGVA